MSQNDRGKAEAEFQKAVSLDPKNQAQRMMLADFYEATGNVGKAQEVIQSLIREKQSDTALKKRLALSYLNQKAYDKAAQVADEVLKGDASDNEARILKAQIFTAQNKTAEAVKELQTVVGKGRGSAQAHYLLGLAYAKDKRGQQAESEWNAAVQIDPKFISAYLALAQYKLDGGDPDSAIRYSQEALKSDQNSAQAHFALGTAFFSKSFYKDAITEFETVLKQNPGNSQVLYRLGMSYARQGDAVKAEAALESALKNNPSDPQSLAGLADLYMARKQPDKAIQRISAQIQKSPQSAVLYELLGQVHAGQKNYVNAEEAFQKSISLDKNRFSAYEQLARIYAVQKSYDKAIAESQKLLAASPQSPQIYILMGMIYEIKNDAEKAKVNYREALKIDSGSAVAANNLAWLLCETGGNLDEALKLAQQAREMMPDSSSVADTLGWIYYKRAAYRSAIDLFEECRKKEPQNATYLYHLGMSYYKSGDQRRAKEFLSQAIKLDVNLPQAVEIKNILAKV